MFGSLITKELLTREFPTVVIGIADDQTDRYARNTLDVLKTYENFTLTEDLPIVIALFQNQGTAKHGETDKHILDMVGDLACLFSGENKGLDSQDLKHWLRFDKVTGFEPSLGFLTTTIGREELETFYGSPITVATLSPQGGDADYPDTIEYQCVGIVPPAVIIEDTSETLHYVITDGVFGELAKKLKKKIAENEDIRESRVKREKIVDDKDQSNEHGLIL